MATRLMGILNVTPDSFYDKGQWNNIDRAISRGIEISKHADFIDIGGESTRPGADAVSEAEELARVIPVIQALKKEVHIPISIDTMKPKVAEAAILAGASLINDVTGFRDPAMRKIAVQAQIPICVMHMLGMPRTMQNNPVYPEGVVNSVKNWLLTQVELLLSLGVNSDNIILDPGIGFGKTVDDNIKIIQNLHEFKALGFPVLIGASRKFFLGKLINKPTEELLSATLAVHSLAIKAKVDIIRVHDVIEHRDLIDILEKF